MATCLAQAGDLSICRRENDRAGRLGSVGDEVVGRNVLICSNLSYCYCFEKNRSFIVYLDLPSASIAPKVADLGRLLEIELVRGLAAMLGRAGAGLDVRVGLDGVVPVHLDPWGRRCSPRSPLPLHKHTDRPTRRGRSGWRCRERSSSGTCRPSR